jgi:hypothetical protein
MDGMVWVGWKYTWIEYYVHRMVHCEPGGSLIAHKGRPTLGRLDTRELFHVCRLIL